MIDIKKLENEICHQVRNGRKDVYVEVCVLKELGYEIVSDADRQFVDAATLMSKLQKYKFREKLSAIKTIPEEEMEKHISFKGATTYPNAANKSLLPPNYTENEIDMGR